MHRKHQAAAKRAAWQGCIKTLTVDSIKSIKKT